MYLYNTALGFLIADGEPYVENDNGSITIQDITDPYPEFLNDIIANYEDYQDTKKLSNLLTTNTEVQGIEAQISQLKKNYMAMLNNSTIAYTNYTGLTTAKQFLFAVLKGTANTNFNLIYRDINNNIIKKEYNCRLNANGLYISVPFFFNIFGNNYTKIKFETSPSITEYYLFE